MTTTAVTPPGTMRGRAWVLAVVCGVLFLTFLDNTIVTVALADMQANLHAGVLALQWIVNGYALTFAALMLAGGTLGDLFGRRKVMLGGILVFCAGSLLGALAPSPGVLIAARVVMGIGAAASEPGTLSILRQAYPHGGARARAVGVWVAVSGVALALGPIIGSALVGADGWQGVFWFNLAFGVFAFVVAASVLPESADPQGRRLDVIGLALGAGALAAATFGVIMGEQDGYSTWWIIALFVLAGVVGIAFVLYERRAADPVLPLRFFRRPTFTGVNVVAFCAFFGVFAIFFPVALYLQLIARHSAYHIALDFMPLVVGMVVSSLLAGLWVARSGPRSAIVAGCLLACAGIYATDSVLRPGIGYGMLSWPLTLAGVGFGLAIVPATSAALTEVPPERSGMAASTTNTSRELGAVLGVAVLGAIANSELRTNLQANSSNLKTVSPIARPFVQQQADNFINQGGIPTTGPLPGGGIDTALQNAYYAGVNVALLAAGSLIAVAAVVSALTVRRPRDPHRAADVA